MQEREYLELLIQSLKKKLLLLNQIIVLNQQQKEMLMDENLDPDTLDVNVREKDELISQVTQLDDGFDEVYAHIADLMKKNHSDYEEELDRMRELIRQIMAKDASIRTDEQRNYELAQKKFARVKKQIREVKTSQKMVNRYYQNMMQQRQADIQYMDNKK
ncbi:MAG: flagellar protein FliT [Lachnospiraceae bacterium]|nr:flagellar protein FliT [Lachnospiraceae bacterium]MDY3818809.1 flagellar protein FliT [Lachnospiraceae bacterium]